MTYNIIYVLFDILVLVNFWASAFVQAHSNSEIQQQQHYLQSTNNNIFDFLKQLPETSKLVSIMDQTTQTYLSDSKNRNVTFFAPNNHALENSSGSSINWDYHILPNFSQLDWNATTSIQKTRYNHHTLVKLYSNNQGQKTIGSGLMQYVNVTKSIQINNGCLLVHIIDQVLTVPQNLTTTLTKLGLTKARALFENLPVGINDQITLFVPNNEAFGTVDPTTLADNLFAQSHVSNIVSTSNLWINCTIIQSLNHLNMTITSKKQQISNNNMAASTNWQVSESIQYSSNITTLDILLENGVMHIIDQVLWATANNWDGVTTFKSNASQIKLNQPIIDWTIILLTFVIFVMLKNSSETPLCTPKTEH